MEWWLISILCLTGLFLIFLEVFIPSGGVLAIAALLCIAYSIWELHLQGETTLAIVCAVLTAAWIALLFRFWLNRVGLKADLGNADSVGDDVRNSREMVGERGLVMSDLRPAGIALIAGKRLDVVALQGYINKGDSVVVIQSDGNRIVVKKAESEESES